MINLFGEINFNKVETIVNQNIKSVVENIDEKELLNSDIDLIVKDVAAKTQIKILDIDLEKREFKLGMETITGRQLPGFDVRPDEKTERAKVSYKFSLKQGDVQLLSVAPKNAYISERIHAEVNKNSFTIQFQTTSQSETLSEEIKKAVKEWRDKTIAELTEAIKDVNSLAEKFNLEILPIIKSLIEERLSAIKIRNDQNDSLA